MYFDDLYNKILLDPLHKNPQLNKLLIVSGYATATMSSHYLNDLKDKKKNIKIELIVGMTSRDGIVFSNHSGFKELVSSVPSSFRCSYIRNNIAIHSKVYVWCHDDEPAFAFTGSANYTQTAFCLGRQQETMTSCSPDESHRYFCSAMHKTIDCNDPEVEQFITVYKDNSRKIKYQEEMTDNAECGIDEYSRFPCTTVSLLDKQGELPQRSGLNWGQRPEANREPNQAYIPLKSAIYKSDFFPPRSVYFTLLTDDGKVFICTRAQDNGKAIHTPHNNSLIGKYFRNRLGIREGVLVTNEHLQQYGRTDITFYKADDETYYMDFRP